MVKDSDRTGTSEEVLVEVAGHEDVEGLQFYGLVACRWRFRRGEGDEVHVLMAVVVRGLVRSRCMCLSERGGEGVFERRMLLLSMESVGSLDVR